MLKDFEETYNVNDKSKLFKIDDILNRRKHKFLKNSLISNLDEEVIFQYDCAPGK